MANPAIEVLKAIASVLKISETQIKSHEEWAQVYFVRFANGRPKFVSKKEVAKAIAKRNTQLWVLPYYGKENWHNKVWVARLTGFDPKYNFVRDWLENGKSSRNREGGKNIEFKITEPGIYHDWSGSYFEVKYTEEGLRFCRFLAGKYEAYTILANMRSIPIIK